MIYGLHPAQAGLRIQFPDKLEFPFMTTGLSGLGNDTMDVDQNQQDLLKMIPGVDRILEQVKTDGDYENIPKSILVRSIRSIIDNLRDGILQADQNISKSDLSTAGILLVLKERVMAAMALNLRRTVNATGVVVHTNLGRSLLAREAVENISRIAERYSNLEFDLAEGRRGSRYSNVEDILCELTGAESAMVVNNNAGAVLLSLETIARGRKVVVSRGELVEIGGSFRIPDVMERSGAILKEVGTTNRTHLKDYRNAVDTETGLLLKVHKSNFSIVGFSKEVPIQELVALGEEYHIPVMEDLGSGTFIDFSAYGLAKEPTVQESVAAGTDVVTFSGDKLLGGPQAGLILGKKDVIEKIKENPITRALRIDKLTLAALESTLRLYRNPNEAVQSIPTLRMILLSREPIERHAQALGNLLEGINDSRLSIRLMDMFSRAGGGALPLLSLPTKCVGVKVKGMSVNGVERKMRGNCPPIIGRIEEDLFVMDMRTVQDEELQIIVTAFEDLLRDA
jgi:L-seryl-tRNA(Ser) seleniumtransferase